MSLEELLFKYCNENGLPVFPSEIESLDFIIGESTGVMVRDWNRALGFNVVILAERLKKQYHELSEVIIFTNTCSAPAESLAKRIGVPLFRHWELSLQTRNRRKDDERSY